MEEFKINDYITLKLEDGKTNIYVKGEKFMTCKYLLFNITDNNREKYNEIKSIDEATELLDKSMENINAPLSNGDALTIFGILPEVEFWAHSSNLQVWAENDYDMRLLHSNLAFPLLKKLTNKGDPIAKKIFKEEVVKRFLEGPQKIREFFCNDRGYIDMLSKEERRVLFKSGIEVIEELEEIMQKNFEYHRSRQFRIVVSRQNLINTIMWKEGKVVGLSLNCAGLNEIPEPIRRLKDLEILVLSHIPNEEIPDWFSELKSLKHLELQVGKLKRFPEWIGELKSLEYLNVYHNEIEYIPESIGDLTSLKYLKLNENNIKDLPESIGNLILLEYLNLNKNKLESIPESIGNLISLKELNLESNLLESIPDSIGNLKLLEELIIMGNKLHSLPASISEMKSLKKFSVSHNPMRDLPQEIAQLPSLKIIYLVNTRITKNWHLKNILEKKGVEVYFGKNN